MPMVGAEEGAKGSTGSYRPRGPLRRDPQLEKKCLHGFCIQGREAGSPDGLLAPYPACSTSGPGPDSTRTFQVPISGLGCQFRG